MAVSREPDSTARARDELVVSVAPVGAGPFRPGARWGLLAGALAIALGAALVSAGLPEAPLALVASPSPSSSELAPTPVVAAILPPTASPDPGPCGTGRVQFQSQDDPEPQRDVPGLRVPTSGLLALAVEDNAQQGVLLLASAGATGTTTANVIATYWGSNLQPGQAVTPLGWSADGYELLVSAGHVSSSLVEASCSDLYIVRYEDSRVIVSEVTGDPSGNGAASGASTGNGLPGRAEEGAVSPDGSLVAYFESGELWLVDVHDRGSLQGLDRCRDHLGTPRWSPDGTHLFALCEGSIVVADTSEFTSGSLSVERFSGPRGALLLTAGWAADSRSILTVAAVTGKALSSPLEIIAFDAASGAGTERAVTLTQTQWVLGPAAMSPDGRWALLQGNDTYALDIATGEATNLPWIVFSAARDTVAWLPDGNTFLYADSGTLYEIDLASMTRTEVGAIPVSNFAWHESPK